MMDTTDTAVTDEADKTWRLLVKKAPFDLIIYTVRCRWRPRSPWVLNRVGWERQADGGLVVLVHWRKEPPSEMAYLDGGFKIMPIATLSVMTVRSRWGWRWVRFRSILRKFRKSFVRFRR